MQANRNQLERGRLEEYIAVEFEGELKQDFDGMDKPDDPAPYYILSNGRLLTHAPKGNGHTITWGEYPVYELLERRHRDGKIRIIDAVKIPIRKKDFSTFLVDCSFEPLVIIPGKPKGIAIFPADLLEPGELFGSIDRKILRCISNQTGKKSKALEQIREIAETISTDTPADEPPPPDAPPRDDIQTDDAAPVETKPKKRRLPAGFKEIKENPLSNDRGEPVEMEPSTLKKLEKVLPYIQEVKKRKTLSAHQWKRPDANSSKIQPGRNETIIIEHNGIRYRIIYAKCEIDGKEKYRFGVRIYEITKNGTEAGPTYFFFTGRA